MKKLITLSDDEDKKIAIKACTEILDRTMRKEEKTAQKWFVDDEKS